MTVTEFINNFVGHNSTVCLYERNTPDIEDRSKDTFKLLWKGMDWQADGNQDDEEYCKNRGFDICPYKNKRVIQVKQFPHENFSDFVDLLII